MKKKYIIFSITVATVFAFSTAGMAQTSGGQRNISSFDPNVLFDALKEKIPPAEDVKLKVYDSARNAVENAANSKIEEINADVHDKTGVDLKKFSAWLLEMGKWLIELLAQAIDWLTIKITEKEPL